MNEKFYSALNDAIKLAHTHNTHAKIYNVNGDYIVIGEGEITQGPPPGAFHVRTVAPPKVYTGENFRPATFNDIRPGDRVTFLVPNGIGRDGVEWKEKSGRATLVFANHVVCNCGGRSGTPGVCDGTNYVKHSTPRAR